LWLVVGAVCFLVLYGCKRKETNVIRVVSSLPMQGSALAQSQSIVNGIKMAFEEVNYEVGGFKIEYESWDDATAQAGQWDSAAEAKNANKAVADRDIMAYIGTYNSGAAKISIPILNRADMLMVSPANTYAGLTKPGQGEPHEPGVYRPKGRTNFFRVVPTDEIQGVAQARWAKKMGVTRVFILDDRELYGKGVADMFESECKRLGIEVLGHEGIDKSAQEYKALMTKIKGLGPELICFGGTTASRGDQIPKDMRNVGLDAKLVVPDGCFEEAFITGAGAENVNDRVFATFGGVPPDQLTGKGAEFYQKYKAKYNAEPAAYSIYGYECARVVIESIRRAGKKDRQAILEACRGMKDFDGTLGKWSFDENGDTSLRLMSGSTVKNGKFVFVEMLSAE
jgi:branched-chain amino acid transport system substrate-binding protein